MHDALLIAKREYLEQVRGKAFKVTTVLIPLVFAGIIGIIAFAGSKSGTNKHLIVAADDPAVAQRIAEQLLLERKARMRVEVVSPAGPSEHTRLLQATDKKSIDGFVWVAKDADGHTTAKYESRSSGDFVTQGRVTNAVDRAVVEQRLAMRGVASGEVAELTRDVDVKTIQVKNGREYDSDAMSTFWAAYAMAFLLSFTVVMYGMNVGRSVIQEKTSRIFEVMLASVRPGDLLAGKLVGIGAVGLTQLAIWGAAAALAAGSPIAAMVMSGNFVIQITPVEVLLFCAYFLLGYGLYSALFAGLAATLDTEQELQQYAPLAAIPIWLSFGMITFIVSNPNSFWSVAISMFPPCAPITMFLRFASQVPPAWQIGLSLFLMVIAVYAVLWASSRIYRVGILMYGKRATLPEMLRWLRYS